MSTDYKFDLAAIRARCEKATEGPWTVRTGGTHSRPNEVHGIFGPQRTEDYGSGPFRTCDRIVETDCGHYEPKFDDAQFIAHARTDIPALLARVEELECERDMAITANAANCVATDNWRTEASKLRALLREACDIAWSAIPNIPADMSDEYQRIAAIRTAGGISDE